MEYQITMPNQATSGGAFITLSTHDSLASARDRLEDLALSLLTSGDWKYTVHGQNRFTVKNIGDNHLAEYKIKRVKP